MPPVVTLHDSDGRAVGVPEDQVAAFIQQGFRPETHEEGLDRVAADTFRELHGGVGGALEAGGLGALSGLTLGLSDQALAAGGGNMASLRHVTEEHPYATAAGALAGALAPAIMTGGASAGEEAAGLGARILSHSPAALVGRAGRAISELGEGGGIAGRILAGTAGAATEGAVFGGGQYLTDAALEDKPLSAEGFVAGMGHGALFAAPIGGAGVLASATLQKVRSLFPRSEVSAAAASGIKAKASSGIAQVLRDGDQMTTAAERRLADIDAGAQVARAGESATRRVFGAADSQAIGDQVAGAVNREAVTGAIDAYRQARGQFESWLADGGDPELERELAGIEPGDLHGNLHARAVPVGEFGPPGARGIKTPGELQHAAELGGDPVAATPLVDQPATAVGKRLASGTPIESVPARKILQNATDDRPSIEAGIPERARVAGRYAAAPMKDGNIPEYGALNAHLDRVGHDYVEQTLPARKIAERGYFEPPGGGVDEVRMANARNAIAVGQQEPIKLGVSPDGNILVTDGRHRLAAAIEADAPIKVKWTTSHEPAPTDVLRGAGHGEAQGGLEALLRGTKAAVDRGAGIAEVGREPARAARAAKESRASSAAEHFRARALAARAERAGLGDAAAPWNEGMTPGAGHEGSAMAAHERELQAQAREAASAAAWDAARAGEVMSSPTGLTGLHHQLGLNPPRGEAAVSERGTTVDSMIKERMAGVRDEAAIAKAIMRHNAKAGDIGPDIGRAAKVVGDLESASARLTDVLGGEAPRTAVDNAAAYRAAIQAGQNRAAASSAKAAADLAGKVPAVDATVVDDEITTALRQHEARGAAAPKLLPGAVPAEEAVQGGGGRLADIGSALEVLRAVGAHVPAVSSIPVIGPILGLWLKARAVMGVLGRKGGSIGRSTEGMIASTAAAARDRIVAATSALLDGGAKAASKAPRVAGPAVLLAGSLFPGGKDAADDSPRALFEARSDDITRALQPGAIDQAIGQRYPTSDPAMQAAIVAQVQRGIMFLDSKRPRQTLLPGMIPGDGGWHPSIAAMEEFGRYVHAVNDPISVIEDIAHGTISAEGAETLRVVYPEMFGYAQKALLRASQEMAKTLPYPRRVTLSILYRLPIDGTMQVAHAQYLAASIPAAAPRLAQPSTSGPLRLGQQTMSPLDHRAAGM